MLQKFSIDCIFSVAVSCSTFTCRLIREDAEAFVDMKHEMEDNIRKLNDQIQFLDAIHQLNEVR